ncbi:hypothetical protein ACF0H5_015733 [Mactra antiquata]
MDLARLTVFVFIVFGVCFVDANRMRRLTRGLINNYDKLSLPQPNDELPLNVNHSIELKRIVSLENQVLTLDATISMFWRDDQLVWNPEDFGDITLINLPSSLIWKPDVILENNAEHSSGIHSPDINVVVLNDGVLFYIFPVKIQSYCRVKHKNLKRGSRVNCILKFLSWTHDGTRIDLNNSDEQVHLSGFEDFNDEWKLIDHRVTRKVEMYECCPEPYIHLLYEFDLEKK